MSYNDLFSLPGTHDRAAAADRMKWNELNLNRSTLSAFMRAQQANETKGKDKQSYLEKFMEESTAKAQDEKDEDKKSYLEKYIEKSMGKTQDKEDEEKKSPLDKYRDKSAEKAQDKKDEDKMSPLEKYRAEKTERTAEAKKAEKAEEVSGEKTAEAVKDKEKEENYLVKLITKSTKKLSPENKEISSYSTEVSDSALRLEDAIERDQTSDEKESGSAYGAAEDLVNKFNKLSESIRASSNGMVSGKSAFLNKMLDAFGERLKKVGVTEDENGRLSIDRDKFESASPRDMERAFGRKNSFASFIEEQARQLANYAQSDIYKRAGAYSDAGNITTVTNINGSFMNMMG